MRGFQHLIVLFLFCLISNGIYAQTPYKVTAKRLNVRSQPSTQANVVGAINYGEIISVLRIKDGWATITFRGKTRYVAARYIMPLKESQPTERSKVEETANHNNSPSHAVTSSQSQQSHFEQRNKKKNKRSGQLFNINDFHVGLLVDLFGGYSNFLCSGVSPKFGLGFGGGLTGQLYFDENDNNPNGYFAELGINYKRKGSGAYPIDYANAQLLPIGYSFNLFGDFSLFIKAGGYISYPFSDLKTKQKSFNTNLDYGAIGCVGVSYEKFSVSVSYEHGFADVIDAKISLNNQNIFLTLSYRLF